MGKLMVDPALDRFVQLLQSHEPERITLFGSSQRCLRARWMTWSDGTLNCWNRCMRLDVTPLCPAVIDGVAYDALDELRRFRRLFRHAYGVKLDPLRLQLVMRKALALRTVCAGQMEQFIEFLQGLA